MPKGIRIFTIWFLKQGNSNIYSPLPFIIEQKKNLQRNSHTKRITTQFSKLLY